MKSILAPKPICLASGAYSWLPALHRDIAQSQKTAPHIYVNQSYLLQEDLTVPDTSLHAMQAAQEEQGYQDDLLLTYSMWDPQVILQKCKRKRRLAARQRREEELPSSSEHSSDEEYVRPVYEKKRQNRYCLAKIEAEKEKLYLELAKCKKKLASAQRKCSAQAAKLTAARPGPSVVPRMPFPGRALIPVLTQARPMISIYNPGNPCRPPVCFQSNSAGSTPRLTVKGPKRTYASKRNPLPPNTHPDSLPTSSSWTSQTPIAHSVGQDHLLCQNNILRRQRNLTINSNIPDTFTADSNLPKFFPTSMSYATNMNYSVPYVPNNIQPPPVSSIYQQFNMAGLGHSYNPRAQPVSPAYFNSSPYNNKAAYQPVLNPHNPYQYGNVDLNSGWNNNYQTNGVHYNQGQVPQTLTVTSAPTIRHHIPSSTFTQIPNSQFQPGSGCHSNLQNVGFSAAVTPAFPPPSYESHVNQAAISFPSEVEIMSPNSGVLNPDPSSYNGQPASSGIS